jgi:hypothetical protein
VKENCCVFTEKGFEKESLYLKLKGIASPQNQE